MFDTYYIKHNKYIAQIKEDIDDAEKVWSTSGKINLKSFDLHDVLNDKIWDKKNNIRPDIREDLINIAHDFYDTLDIAEITEDGDPDQKPDKTFDKYIKDVLFVGSLASFNYSSYADIDLHLLMDENLLVGNNKLALNILKKYFTECKNDWNLKHANLKIEGYDVELYVQDIKEENASNGVYSLMTNKWIKMPKKLDTKNFDRALVEKKAIDYIEQIDSLEEVITSNSDLELVEKAKDELKKIKDKIVQGRRDSLAAGQGEMNSYNILFKILRRSGHIGKINDLMINAYDMLNSIDNQNNLETKEESKTMKIYTVAESETDDIAEFEKMYGPQAGKALRIYLAKRTKQTASNVLNSDKEFDKFANWAYKHLGIDVYEKFATYDTGPFNKRTSDLVRDPEQRGDRRYDTTPGDDTRYSYEVDDDLGGFDNDDTINWDKDFPDGSEDDFQEESITEDGSYTTHEPEIRQILNTKWTDPFDFDPDEEPYQYRFIISIEVGKVASFVDKALNEYSISHDKEAFLDKFNRIVIANSATEVPEEVINDYANKILSLVEVKVESIQVVEDDENQETKEVEKPDEKSNEKAKLYIGKMDDNISLVITMTEPKDDANKILDKYNKLAKEEYQKAHDGKEDGYTPLKWEKDPSYNYWVLMVSKGLNDLKKELETEFGNIYDVEIKESKVKEDNQQPEQSLEQQAQETAQLTNNQVQQDDNQQPQDQNNNQEQTSDNQPEQTQESESTPKITGATWEEFLKNVEEQSIYKVDAAFKRHPNQWVELIDDTGKIYDGEVTSYSDGSFELLYSNIHPVPNAEESKKQTPINESYADDAIDNIKDVLKKYFEVDPETEEENPEFDENFTAQEAIDEIVDILY